eukprot:scaffold29824_cov130-Isochrysis_galbana.AAC.1
MEKTADATLSAPAECWSTNSTPNQPKISLRIKQKLARREAESDADIGCCSARSSDTIPRPQKTA